MMLGFMVSSVVGGQILARTGRYKLLALTGFAIAAFGTYLLSRMGLDATNGLVVRNMIVTGLGIGVMMSLFTIVVQNAFPYDMLGAVTANLQFFRSIGGTIGVAVLGTVMTNHFQNQMAAQMPAGLTRALPAGASELLQNPQAILSPEATAALQQRFASFGPQGQSLLAGFLDAVRVSLCSAITDLFLVSLGATVLGFVVTLFLPEIPLRKSHHEVPTEAQQSAEAQQLARSRSLLGALFALLALEAQRPSASPELLETIASLGERLYPATWSVADRAHAVARELLEPAAMALLASFVPDEHPPVPIRVASEEMKPLKELALARIIRRESDRDPWQ